MESGQHVNTTLSRGTIAAAPTCCETPRFRSSAPYRKPDFLAKMKSEPDKAINPMVITHRKTDFWRKNESVTRWSMVEQSHGLGIRRKHIVENNPFSKYIPGMYIHIG